MRGSKGGGGRAAGGDATVRFDELPWRPDYEAGCDRIGEPAPDGAAWDTWLPESACGPLPPAPSAAVRTAVRRPAGQDHAMIASRVAAWAMSRVPESGVGPGAVVDEVGRVLQAAMRAFWARRDDAVAELPGPEMQDYIDAALGSQGLLPRQLVRRLAGAWTRIERRDGPEAGSPRSAVQSLLTSALTVAAWVVEAASLDGKRAVREHGRYAFEVSERTSPKTETGGPSGEGDGGVRTVWAACNDAASVGEVEGRPWAFVAPMSPDLARALDRRDYVVLTPFSDGVVNLIVQNWLLRGPLPLGDPRALRALHRSEWLSRVGVEAVAPVNIVHHRDALWMVLSNAALPLPKRADLEWKPFKCPGDESRCAWVVGPGWAKRAQETLPDLDGLTPPELARLAGRLLEARLAHTVLGVAHPDLSDIRAGIGFGFHLGTLRTRMMDGKKPANILFLLLPRPTELRDPRIREVLANMLRGTHPGSAAVFRRLQFVARSMADRANELTRPQQLTLRLARAFIERRLAKVCPAP